jgi:hypothetical protein
MVFKKTATLALESLELLSLKRFRYSTPSQSQPRKRTNGHTDERKLPVLVVHGGGLSSTTGLTTTKEGHAMILALTVEQMILVSRFLGCLLDKRENHRAPRDKIYVLGGEEAPKQVEVLDANTLRPAPYSPVHVIQGTCHDIWHGFNPGNQAIRWRSPKHDDTLLAVPVWTAGDCSSLEGFLLEASTADGGSNRFIEMLELLFEPLRLGPLDLKWQRGRIPRPDQVDAAILEHQSRVVELFRKQ